MQVDPMKPKLKPPGNKQLKLKCDVPLSNFAFKFNLRRYNQAVMRGEGGRTSIICTQPRRISATSVAARVAGAYTRPVFSST